MRPLLFALLCAAVSLPALAERSPTGTITTVATCPGTGCVISDAHGSGSSIVTITGTWTGTLVFEVQKPDATWTAIQGVPQGGGASATSTTANGTWLFTVAPYRAFRINGPVGTGSAVIGIDTNLPQILVAATAAQLASNDASQAQLAARPGDWGINHTPAVSTQASASKTAGSGTVRHVATSCSGAIATVAAQTVITLALRDGATGAGTVLWSKNIVCPINAPCGLESPLFNIVGSAATAMTCEWSGAPVATNFAVANLNGYDTR